MTIILKLTTRKSMTPNLDMTQKWPYICSPPTPRNMRYIDVCEKSCDKQTMVHGTGQNENDTKNRLYSSIIYMLILTNLVSYYRWMQCY